MAQAHKDEDAKHGEPKHEDAKRETLHMPPAEPAKGDEKPKPVIGVSGEPIEDGARDPLTAAEEQRRRSAEYEANPQGGPPPESKGQKLPPPPSKK